MKRRNFSSLLPSKKEGTKKQSENKAHQVPDVDAVDVHIGDQIHLGQVPIGILAARYVRLQNGGDAGNDVRVQVVSHGSHVALAAIVSLSISLTALAGIVSSSALALTTEPRRLVRLFFFLLLHLQLLLLYACADRSKTYAENGEESD